MKIKIIILLFVIFTGSSCNKALDIVPEGRLSLDDIFKTPTGAAAYLNTCYKFMQQRGLAMDSWNSNSLILMSDEAWDRDDMEGDGQIFAGPVYRGSLSPASPLFTTMAWNNNWSGIRACNIFIERIPAAPTLEGATEGKPQWIAEAKVLRAHYLLELIIRHGGLPILTESLSIDDNCSTLRRESFKNCVDQILKDCDEAIAESSLPWRVNSSSKGYRMTKAIAYGIKSRAILFLASDLWNEGQNYWAQAETITKTALDECIANGYEIYKPTTLKANYKSAYDELFCLDASNVFADTPTDKETIMLSKSNSQIWNLHGLTIMNGAKAGLCPTQELVDAYPMKSTGLPVLKLDDPYLDDQHLQANYYPGSGYDQTNPYLNRDPRLESSIYCNGAKRLNQTNVPTTIETYEGGNCAIQANSRKNTRTGYYMKKYDNPLARVGSNGDPANPFRMMRLAELYLNYAEAANENGNMNDAVLAIKPIRDRVDMPNIAPATKDEARLLIRNERRIELAFEEKRHFDVRRWQKPYPVGNLEETDRYLTGMWIVKNGAVLEYNRIIIGDSRNASTGLFLGSGIKRETYQSKYLIWPIELNESNRLRGATGVNWQNPGW